MTSHAIADGPFEGAGKLAGAALSIVLLIGQLSLVCWYLAGMDGRVHGNTTDIEAIRAQLLPQRVQSIEDRLSAQRDDITTMKAGMQEMNRQLGQDRDLLSSISGKLDMIVRRFWDEAPTRK